MIADPPELTRIREQIRAAARDSRQLTIRGGGSKDFYGQQISGELLSTAAYRGIVSYEPTELVVTARAGTLLSELNDALAAHGQCLPFEPPQFGTGSTIGGVVAAGLSGPRRPWTGSVRDYVLGANMIDSRGQWLSFGGQVMKNVAGYDVARLLSGSLGILGLIAEVSVKVLPVAASEGTVQLTIDEARAIRLINQLAGQPLPLSASAWHDQQLRIRFSGAQSAVDAATAMLIDQHEAEPVDAQQASAFWRALRDHRLAFFQTKSTLDDAPNGIRAASPQNDAALWRLSVPSTAPVFELSGQQLVEWGGALRWIRTAAPATTVRAAAHAVGGSACLFRGGDKSVGVFDPLPAPLAAIHQRLKSQLDPHRLFNLGRMYADL